MDETQRSILAPGTTKRGTLNMYDMAATTFQPLPDGPYEDETLNHHGTAQLHYKDLREIKLRATHGSNLPMTSYRDHYPPKEVPMNGDGLDLSAPGAPFTTRSEYMDEFLQKPRMPRPAEGKVNNFKPAPWIGLGTTNQHFHKPFDVPFDNKEPATKRATSPPRMIDPYNTTYRHHYVPKDGQPRMGPGEVQPRNNLPWLNDGTTYRNHYIPYALKPVDMAAPQLFVNVPFDATTEYRAEYVPKEAEERLPPLTGVVAKEGLQLPLPRKSLGVQFLYRGDSDQYYVLIPRTLGVPCAARQTFTTVVDNQEEACILVLYGDDPVASNNMLLGQFTVVNIPPAPKDVPRIEVTFHLNKDCFLTAEAKDLDTARHKKWIQRGEIIVLKA